MPSQTWILDGGCARLQLSGLKGCINSSQPEGGLTSIVFHDTPCRETRLLGVSCTALVAAAAVPVDWYVRGDDLVAAYEIGQPDAARIDISWRAVASEKTDAWFACIDLVVSVRTERLDWRHDIAIESRVPGTVASHEPSNRPGCCVFRAERWAYADFVHAADLRNDELHASVNGPAGSRVRRQLFSPESLEKGVILRGRARGLFLPASAPAAAIANYYAEFIATDPPLGG